MSPSEVKDEINVPIALSAFRDKAEAKRVVSSLTLVSGSSRLRPPHTVKLKEL